MLDAQSAFLTWGNLMCDHLYDTTSRYDAAAKLLTFVLVCPVCRTERVIETLQYEPRLVPRSAWVLDGVRA